MGNDPITCFTCDVVDEYVRLANAFTQELSEVLVGPMWVIFLSLAGLWIAIHGIKMMLGKGDLAGLSHEFVFVAIAAVLMAGQGPSLVNNVYSASLSVMGGAASAVISTASITSQTGVSDQGAESSASSIPNVGGMRKLVFVAETGVMKVFGLATEVLKKATLTNWSPILYAILLALPYILLLVVYFAQVIVSIFRIVVLAALSPVLMMCFGFGWGRGMAFTALRTLFSSFMVLFGATIALAVCLYGVRELAVAEYSASTVDDVLSLTSATLWVAIVLGWCGTAFLTEATGIANSISGSQLTNSAATVITGGAVTSGIVTGKLARDRGWPGLKKLGLGLGQLADQGGQKLSPMAQQIMDRVKNPGFDRGDSK